ncbi:hypothetical protein DFH07DRAFT_759648, partial [Mycena maculata]
FFRDPKLIVDADGRIIAALLGRPEGCDWDSVIEEMERVMAGVLRRGRKRRIFLSKNLRHRRGKFHLLSDGYSMGSGQRVCHFFTLPAELLTFFPATGKSCPQQGISTPSASFPRELGHLPHRRLSYFPKLSKYIAQTMLGIEDDQTGLRRPFKNSVYPGVTFNLGPDTVTAEHRDGHNLAHGVCPITSAGKFNHKTGGHFYMRQLKVVIEFPPGSSMAILSGAVDHGNTPISKGETRYSMTQYAAGALFCWAAYSYKTARNLLETAGGAEKKALFDSEPGVRAAWAVSLLSKVDELEADRIAAFGADK